MFCFIYMGIVFFLSILTRPLYCLEYNEIVPGQFAYNGQTGFARFYQTEDQIGTSFCTAEIDDAHLLYSNCDSPQHVSIKDINNDGWDDLITLNHDYGPVFSAYNLQYYHGGISIYLSEDNASMGSAEKKVQFYTLSAIFIKPSTFFHYDKIFLQDIDYDGKNDYLLVGWNENHSTLDWQMMFYTLDGLAMTSNLKGRGSILTQESVQDLTIFKDATSSVYHIITQSDQQAIIYSYNGTVESFELIDKIQTQETLLQISALESGHALLSSYNLLFLVGQRPLLISYSKESQRKSYLQVESFINYHDQGYEIEEIYLNSTSSDGKFAIWWQHRQGGGMLVFYSITLNEIDPILMEEVVDNTNLVVYNQKPFKVVYRSSNGIDNGGWLVIQSDRASIDNYDY